MKRKPFVVFPRPLVTAIRRALGLRPWRPLVID
jgi:hypothetical protein